MNTEEIIVKIQNSLKQATEESRIPKSDVRIKLSIKKGFVTNSVISTLMNKTEIVHDLDFQSLLKINMIQFALVNTFLSKTLVRFSEELGIKDTDVNVRLCTKSEDYSPVAYLFNGIKYISEIKMEELTS